MAKALLALGALTAGGAAMGVAVYLNTNPWAMTDLPPPMPEPRVAVPVVVPEIAPIEVDLSDEDADRPAPPARRVRAAPPAEELAPKPLAPCSGWRELGPGTVPVEGEVIDHSVRTLCR